MSKNELLQRKISISELPTNLPDFSSSFEPKDSIIKKWIINWILSAINKKQIKENDILPTKSEISNYLGVSVGTVQNAIRYVEDEGFLKSKQRTGTMIAGNSTNPITNVKATSKRDYAVIAVKMEIINGAYKINSPIISARKMSEIIQQSHNTTRLAYELLCTEGVLANRNIRGNDSNWFLVKKPIITREDIRLYNNDAPESLVEKITSELKSYLFANFEIGDKIPSHDELSKKLNVSIKTVNDCIAQLSNQRIILTRRGRYGSVLLQKSDNNVFSDVEQANIFASSSEAAFYSYQKTEDKIVDLISKNYKSGDKLPSMQELSKSFDVSTNTIRKALTNLAEEGYISFSRGRFGGTFVLESPTSEDNEKYQWIAINPDYI